jgi:hypothetical protein
MDYEYKGIASPASDPIWVGGVVISHVSGPACRATGLKLPGDDMQLTFIEPILIGPGERRGVGVYIYLEQEDDLKAGKARVVCDGSE